VLDLLAFREVAVAATGYGAEVPKVRVAVALGDETETALAVEHFAVLVAMAIPSFPCPNRPGDHTSQGPARKSQRGNRSTPTPSSTDPSAPPPTMPPWGICPRPIGSPIWR
jgi:hypothetical protein